MVLGWTQLHRHPGADAAEKRGDGGQVLPRFGSCGTEITPLLAVENLSQQRTESALRASVGPPSVGGGPDVRSPRMSRTSSRQASCLASANVNDELVRMSRSEPGSPTASYRVARRGDGWLQALGMRVPGRRCRSVLRPVAWTEQRAAQHIRVSGRDHGRDDQRQHETEPTLGKRPVTDRNALL